MAVIKNISIPDWIIPDPKNLAQEYIQSYSALNKAINVASGLPVLEGGKPADNHIKRSPTKLIYPYDLEGSKEYDTMIRFDIVGVKHSATAVERKAQEKSSSEKPQIANGFGDFSLRDLGTTAGKSKDILGAALGDFLGEPKNSDIQGEYKLNLNASIFMYQPQQLNVEYAKEWSQEELGVAGAALAASGGAIDKLKAGFKQATEGKFTEAAAKYISQLSGIKAKEARELFNKQVVNPRLHLLFRGVGFRSFQFEFMFSPRNERELIDSLAIVKLFKYYSAPFYSENQTHINYPSLFKIKMVDPDGKENHNLFSFKEAACTNVSIDYTPNAVWATFKKGGPVSFKMTLSFTETSIITRSDIYDEGNPEKVGA